MLASLVPQHQADRPQLHPLRQQVEQSEQRVAVDRIGKCGALCTENVQNLFCDPLGRNALCLYAVDDPAKTGGIAAVERGLLAERRQRVGGRAEHAGADRARTQNRYRNAEQLQLHAEREGVTVECAFGHAVQPGEGQRIERRELACCNENPAAAPEQGEEEPVDRKRAAEIDAEALFKPRRLNLDERIQHVNACKMDNGKQPVRDGAHGGDRRGDACGIGQIRPDGDHARIIARFDLAVKRKNTVSARAERLYRCAPHAAVCPCDQNVFHRFPALFYCFQYTTSGRAAQPEKKRNNRPAES